MCGIGYINDENVEKFELIKHRGPDQSRNKSLSNGYTLCFHRLSINDLSNSGMQPFVDDNFTMVCNGEIYNYNNLQYVLTENMRNNIKSNSDCEVLYQLLTDPNRNVYEICSNLDGDFAFIFVQSNPFELIVARDPIGVRPLYWGLNKYNKFEFCSEIKGIQHCKNIEHFPPGSFYTTTSGLVSYQPLLLHKFPSLDYDSSLIKIKLINSVKKRLMSDRPIGFFLSGGLDSSIIAAIGAKLMHPKRIKTFSVGVKGKESPDLIAAKKVATYLNSDHYVYEFTEEEAIECIEKTIWHLESYDCTTIRASVPMFLLSKYVSENHDCRVILSGEGADELFGGYLYFHNAPSPISFHDESISLIRNVHHHDVLRADRCTAGNGLELRVPFFDKEFINYITNISPVYKMYKSHWMEKTILRRAFEGMLPNEILWRQKNGMSDAVGYSWVDFIKQYVNKLELNTESFNHSRYDDFEKNKPMSKEELWYRIIYTNMFGKVDTLKYIWRPKWTNETDPSARKLKQFIN